MSRLWDTPEFWARSEADDMLREMPDVEPAALADSFERSAANYDGGPGMAALIITEPAPPGGDRDTVLDRAVAQRRGPDGLSYRQPLAPPRCRPPFRRAQALPRADVDW